MKISLDGKRPEGEWASFNELCGIGDGQKATFAVPVPASEARSLLFMRDYSTIEPDGELRRLDADGKTEDVKPDGYKLSAEGDALSITFERPPKLGARISCSGLGRKVGDAFKILSMTTSLAKKLDEKLPPEMKKRKRDDIPNLPAIQETCKATFMELVEDWTGIMDGDGNPIPCDPANKKLLLEKTDAITLGLFVAERARAIQRERMSGFETAVRD